MTFLTKIKTFSSSFSEPSSLSPAVLGGAFFFFFSFLPALHYIEANKAVLKIAACVNIQHSIAVSNNSGL